MKKLIPILFLLPLMLKAQESEICCKKFKETAHRNYHPPGLTADNARSDTIDILKYTIILDITDFTTDTIRGGCLVKFVPKMNNISTLSLDLLKLRIDSIRLQTNSLTYTYNDTLLIVQLPSAINIGDTTEVAVYYHGKPRMDASGWGGFYFSAGYAFNLGVGFAANPHNFGRVWFPCFDNFVERSKYEFRISTSNGKIAYCNGYLDADVTNGPIRIRTWKLDDEIPTYLASVAVANYTHVNQTFNGMNGPIPVYLTAVPLDTTNLKNSFINLPSALTTFENRYGPYQWNRIGFCLVPFSSGAMEHSTNIAYPALAANGLLTYETLMAHEFSHQWWGDLATCRTEGDMWINEGMATYSEFIFLEGRYGLPTYKSNVAANHDFVVHYAHHLEGGYRPISNMPHQYTYGDHVYKKGADVAHTLRGYLGDSLFFLGLKSVINTYAFKDLDALDFRNQMAAATQTNLNNFFNDWVLNGGFPHFSIDSFKVTPAGNNFNVSVYVKQKKVGSPNYFNGVPLELTFKAANWAEEKRLISMSGQYANYTFTLPFAPVFTGINMDAKISDSKTQDLKTIKTTGNHFLISMRGRMQINVQNTSITSDSAFVYVEHNYAAPDSFKTWGIPYRLSPWRYWKLSGIFPASFTASATVTYDGRITSGGGGGYLDNPIIPSGNLEDSVVVLYRTGPQGEWSLWPWQTKTIGNPGDRYGTVKLDSIRAGEYAIAVKDYLMGDVKSVKQNQKFSLYPNPGTGLFTLDCGGDASASSVVIIRDLTGREIYRTGNFYGSTRIDLSAEKPGLYFAEWLKKGMPCGNEKFIITRF